jgi:hypothetical protein
VKPHVSKKEVDAAHAFTKSGKVPTGYSTASDEDRARMERQFLRALIAVVKQAETRP